MRNQLNYIALGDSYTIGESVTPEERWPVLLVKSLNVLGFDFASPEIIAKTGWTTDELKAAIDSADIMETYALVTLCIGVNNQYKGRDKEEFRSEFAELLHMSIRFAGNNHNNIIVLSIPDWGVTPFAHNRDKKAITREIEEYNIVKKEECDKLKISFINITKLTREVEKDSSLLALDGLHYSGKMHELWVDEVIKTIQCKNDGRGL